MTEPMTWLLLLRLGAAAVSVALAAAILARDHGLKPNRLIAALLFCNAWWALMEFFLGLQSDPEVATWLLRWMTLGWVPMGVLCMHASVLLSSTDAPRVARSIPFLYGALAICLPLAIATDWVIAGAEKTSIGWQGIFGPGVVVAYGLLMTPAVATLVRWRGVMAFPRSGGQLQLSRIVFYGVLGALIEGTLSGIVLPLLGYDGIGISTTLIALVGVAAAWTLHRFGHALISPEAFAREILDTLEDGVVLIGEGGDLRGANRAFFRMIGERERTVFGRPISDWIPDFDERLASAEGPAFMQVSTRGPSCFAIGGRSFRSNVAWSFPRDLPRWAISRSRSPIRSRRRSAGPMTSSADFRRNGGASNPGSMGWSPMRRVGRRSRRGGNSSRNASRGSTGSPGSSWRSGDSLRRDRRTFSSDSLSSRS